MQVVYIQGAIAEMQIFLKYSHLSFINTTETCNTANEREYTQLSLLVQVEHLRLQIKSVNRFMWGSADFQK